MTDAVELILGPGPWRVTLPAGKLVRPNQVASNERPVTELIREALEKPFGFEPLRRALTPDDHIAVVVDDRLPELPALLSGLFDHLGGAGIQPSAVTLVLAPPARNQGFIDDLPDEWSDVTVEVHDPANDKRIAYLSTTQGGRRVYLNRTVVEADFVVVLAGRRFDPVVGIDGGVRSIFPTLSNLATRDEWVGKMPVRDPLAAIGSDPEIGEIGWLLGTPFFIQVIEGANGTVQDVIGGLVDSLDEGVKRQRARWEQTVAGASPLVIATAAGDLHDLANALANAGRILDGIGQIVLLAEPTAIADDAFVIVRQASSPAAAASALQQEKPEGLAGAMLWSLSARLGSIRLGPDWPDAKELFATPITRDELQQLIDQSPRVAVLTDAHLSFTRVG